MVSVRSTEQDTLGHVHHFRLSVRILAGLVFFIIIAGSLEIGLRLWSLAKDAKMVRLQDDIYGRLYSQAELRRSKEILPQQGGQCVRQRWQGMHWDPRFGLASKTLDMTCAKKLFKSARTKVVLFGGSAMGGAFAPNYLTTIENYAFARDEGFVSINLSESYARLSDMSARFIHEIIELQPNVAVFLVGFGNRKQQARASIVDTNRGLPKPKSYQKDRSRFGRSGGRLLFSYAGIYFSSLQTVFD